MPRQFTQQQYIPQQYTPQPYTLQQYAPPYAAQQMFFEPGAINDASVAAALAVLNRGPAGSSAPSQPQYQALTPDTYSNFYGPPLAANTEAYAGLAVPDYNDPNSPYLPQPEAPPPPPMTTVAPPRQIDSGADGSYGGGYEAASGSDIGAPVGGGIDMGVDAGLGGSGGGGGGKIICTAMNHAYGFGSFRNAIWIKYADKHLTKAHEVGYHTLFLPLVDFGFKRGDGKLNLVVRKVLEWGTRHRSTDLRAELRNKKRDTTGRIIRLIFEPLCYAVGKLKGY
tara:strand:- start:995 stop:1837 length:843 start_codon:yes stop_codon:yes gene_type:complete